MDIHKVIGKLPKPKKGFVLPNHKYTGPYNPLSQQLDNEDKPLPGQEPYNNVDAISMRHDICYRDNSSNGKDGKHDCDDKMLQELRLLNPKSVREKIDKKIVQSLIGVKRKFGLGIHHPSTAAAVAATKSKSNNTDIVTWTDELTNELHKPVKKKFRKRKVIAKGVDSIWAADIVDMQYYASSNRGYKYILMIIDVFSKYGWAIPIKTKKGIEVCNAFKMLWKQKQQHEAKNFAAVPKMLWTDKGKEFLNKEMNTLLQKYNVHLYWTENEEKSCVVERWNRTIKQMMWKYFTKNETGVYINILPKLIEKYNNTYNHAIKCTPTDARKPSNYKHVFDALYKKKDKRQKEEEKKIQIS